ncbi:hypothetical protein SCUP515_09400 [Seiridium cupressi]
MTQFNKGQTTTGEGLSSNDKTSSIPARRGVINQPDIANPTDTDGLGRLTQDEPISRPLSTQPPISSTFLGTVGQPSKQQNRGSSSTRPSHKATSLVVEPPPGSKRYTTLQKGKWAAPIPSDPPASPSAEPAGKDDEPTAGEEEEFDGDAHCSSQDNDDLLDFPHHYGICSHCGSTTASSSRHRDVLLYAIPPPTRWIDAGDTVLKLIPKWLISSNELVYVDWNGVVVPLWYIAHLVGYRQALTYYVPYIFKA